MIGKGSARGLSASGADPKDHERALGIVDRDRGHVANEELASALGPHIGVQLWADGDAHAEMNLAKVDDRWVAEVRTLPDPS